MNITCCSKQSKHDEYIGAAINEYVNIIGYKEATRFLSVDNIF
jgi:hypothetical protein